MFEGYHFDGIKCYWERPHIRVYAVILFGPPKQPPFHKCQHRQSYGLIGNFGSRGNHGSHAGDVLRRQSPQPTENKEDYLSRGVNSVVILFQGLSESLR
jgi:hypothetical protein